MHCKKNNHHTSARGGWALSHAHTHPCVRTHKYIHAPAQDREQKVITRPSGKDSTLEQWLDPRQTPHSTPEGLFPLPSMEVDKRKSPHCHVETEIGFWHLKHTPVRL